MRVQTQELIHEYHLFECIQCGRCTGGCPVSLKTALNIRRIIYESLVRGYLDVAEEGVVWDCTTCLTCTLRCPKGVQPAQVIVGLRTALVDEGRIPSTVRDALKSIAIRGNPLGMAPDDRAAWAADLDIKNVLDEPAEVLLFVGCMASYDPRIQPVARALVEALRQAGVDFGFLGEDEMCCAHEARRMGEKEMFEGVVEEYQEIFGEAQFQRMVTISPHCFNAFKNEYGLDFPVQHYTQVIADLLESGRLTLTNEVNKRVVYHDPCFLGKQNDIYDEPRYILSRIPGLELLEFERSRERSMCCEGGGGRMWAEGTNIEVRLSHQRVRDALDLGAEVVAVACPFCLAMLEDAVKTLDLEDKLQVMDVMELVQQALE